MGCPSLDPRGGTTCARCLSHKLTSTVIGILNFIASIMGIIVIVFQPNSVKPTLVTMDKTEITVAVCILLVSILFEVLLLIGLFKDRRLFIKSFIIFAAVYVLLLMIGFVVNLFTQPSRIGFRGFFNCFITIVLYSVSFCVVRSYYIATYE